MKREPAAAAANKLKKLGIGSPAELVLHLPSRYEDETALTPVEDAPAAKPVLVEARVLRAEIAYRPKRQLIVHAEDLALRFFHFYPSQLKQFQRAAEDGLRVRAFGEVRRGFFGSEMAHPRYRLVKSGEPLPDALTPIYPTTAGLGQGTLRNLVLQALAESALEETLPEDVRERYRLAGFAESVRLLHQPPPGIDVSALSARTHPAWLRMKFDELLAQQLSMRLAYQQRRRRKSIAMRIDGPLLRRFATELPFRLTGAQRLAVDEILRDLSGPHPMQRLLQGDVGSGKTIVAALACLACADSGMQAAVMAPTEILAEQHWRKFQEWFAPLDLRMVWLHGELARKERQAALDAIAEGEAAIAIGTHALFQKGVSFRRLALAIVDEQHRFGVQQRLALGKRSAGGHVPHQLAMSATPIPRTLSMTYYADLDVSILDEMPPGRKTPTTRLATAARRREVLERIRAACTEGQQAYWVCPVIEGGEDAAEGAASDLRTALDTHATLSNELEGLRVGLLHGRLAPEQKTQVMAEFAAGQIDLLVCTTVIEVGVDVPNATLMVIEHAERFGLAQLHQLRGRIGRGGQQSVCVLLYAEPLSDAARARLKVIFENTDGFEIARADLALRGPGELLGERQSGLPLLRYADLEQDEPLVRAAREAAEELLRRDPQLAHKHVERWLPGRHELPGA